MAQMKTPFFGWKATRLGKLAKSDAWVEVNDNTQEVCINIVHMCTRRVPRLLALRSQLDISRFDALARQELVHAFLQAAIAPASSSC